ncbi:MULTISPECIES: hypothetical protein [Pectobacterium]|uniref:hypothetical protein n=1 Tax=Pectobacterium TaxID=122277 RepID=UPI000CD102CA|nr:MULTISPECIES: hypothetical protein [Pectobacterium]POD98060.1 hypothetical protein BVY05_20185 [Pectobacterium odoriferum]RRN97142.1 hypothetical protein DMB79_009695 [Pectobacterium aquaticum]
MISNEELIFSKLNEIYSDSKKDITSLSLNDSGDREFIICDAMAFNYDSVWNCSGIYRNELKEKSPDALFYHDSKLYFVEFKEGGSRKEDIRLKIHEGITTLYHFVCKHIPSITKKEFVDLNINYAVICRSQSDKSVLSADLLNALENSSRKYNLKNLEGFLIKQTAIVDEPRQILNLLHKITAGTVTNICIFEHMGETQNFSITQ